MAQGLGTLFLETVARFPDRPALEVEGRSLSYQQLAHRSAEIAAGFCDDAGPLIAVLGHRSEVAFSGVLAALLGGRGYVPLQPQHPPLRLADMLERSGCHSLVVDRSGEAALGALLDRFASIGRRLTVVAPEMPDLAAWRRAWPEHAFVAPPRQATEAGAAAEDATEARDATQTTDGLLAAGAGREVADDAVAYLLFTSGSTGSPKGVLVSHSNVRAFVASAVDRYAIGPEDRLSQTFDLTFDLSAFDMFVAWAAGACVCCPSEGQKILPASYILGAGLTVWFSVPSTAQLMIRLRMLRPGQYPQLRLALFCGEALPVEVAQAWQLAAPNATIENLYGPTELTIACTAYRWRPGESPNQCARGVVPIGAPLPGMTALVVGDDQREVAPGDEGELIMTGPQLSLGYLDDDERTAAAFVRPPGEQRIFYRTGDRVRRPPAANHAGDEAPLLFLGRLDGQVKVRGHRIEVGEVEAALRERPGVESAVVVPWPRTTAGADGLAAFVTGAGLDAEELGHGLRGRLPGYMQPQAVYVVAQLPLNPNGKVDRGALEALHDTPELAETLRGPLPRLAT